MKHLVHPRVSAEYLRQFQDGADLLIILGSGLGGLVDHLDHKQVIPYKDIPGFRSSKVQGHAGNWVFGTLAGKRVACMQGRFHPYEELDPAEVRLPIYTAKLLGCHSLVVTNAAGSLSKNMHPGELMVIKDHINFLYFNPLVGLHDEEFGPLHPSMAKAYDPEYQGKLLQCGQAMGIALHQGVYIGFRGPNFETEAEVRMAALWGADAVGMSTVHEVIVARQCGLRVAGVSTITNYGEGLTDTPLSHEQTLHYAKQASGHMEKLITDFVKTV